METSSKTIVESMIDSMLVFDGSVVEYMNMIVGFSKGFDLDVTLALGLYQKEGGYLVEVVELIPKCFQMHG